MAIRMVSMAKTVQEKQDEVRPYDQRPAEDVPDYPYGLELNLNNDSMRKLQVNRGQLKPGDRVVGQFVAMVTSANAEQVNTLVEHRATLQLQELGIELMAEEDNRADRMYGGSNEG